MRIRRRGRGIRINHRVSPPDTELEAVAEEYIFSKAQADFRKGSFKEPLRLAEKSLQMCRTDDADGESVKL